MKKYFRTYAHYLSEIHKKELASKLSGKVLDIGCGSSDIKKYINFTEYIGLDTNPSVKNISIVADAHNIPFENEMFDSAICIAVLEHVRNPERVLREIYRVLKSSGKLLVAVPFLQPIHNDPDDFWRWTEKGISMLLENTGFGIIESKGINGFWSTIDYLFLKSSSKGHNVISKAIMFTFYHLIKRLRRYLCIYPDPKIYSTAYFIFCRKKRNEYIDNQP